MEMIYDQQFFIFSSPEQTGRGAGPWRYCRAELQGPSPAPHASSGRLGKAASPFNKGTACGKGSNNLFD